MFFCLFFAVLVNCAVMKSGEVVDLSPESNFSAAEIRAQLQRSQAMIDSLHVIYYSHGSAAHTSVSSSHYVRREFFAKSPCWLVYNGSHGHGRLDWRDDPFNQRVYLTKDRFVAEFPFNRIYYEADLAEDDPLPGSLYNEAFFICSGIWPFDSRPPSRPLGRAHMLREICTSDDYGTVRQRQEWVRGRWCHVLENPGLDELWIDVERGCAIVERRLYDSVSGGEVIRIELGGHREISSGIWMPRWIRFVQYDLAIDNVGGSRRIIKSARLQMESVSINDVEGAVFEFRPLPGSLAYDYRSPDLVRQVVPGGIDHLDKLIAWARRIHPREEVSLHSNLNLGYLAGLPFVIALFARKVCRRGCQWIWRRCTSNQTRIPTG